MCNIQQNKIMNPQLKLTPKSGYATSSRFGFSVRKMAAQVQQRTCKNWFQLFMHAQLGVPPTSRKKLFKDLQIFVLLI